jgi:N utilization substance protein B
MSLVKPKTISRIATVQSLYYYHSTSLDINEVIQNVKEFYLQEKLNPDSQFFGLKLNKEYFYHLTLSAVSKALDIDSAIEQNIINQSNITQQHLIMLSILKAGVAELYYSPETPFKVVINEFSNIAGSMLMEKEVNFVNSLLQKISDNNPKRSIKNDPFA